MRILFLTQIIPYPPNAGPRVKTWNVLRYLVKAGHQVTLVSFIRDDEREFLPVVEGVCEQVFTVPITRSRVADVGYLLKSNLTGRPFLIERDDLKGMRSIVRRLLNEQTFDAMHADQLTMMQFTFEVDALPEDKRPFTIFDAHNATWTISDRMFENMPWFMKPILHLETKRIRKYEAMLVERCNHTMVVIEQDREALVSLLEENWANKAKERISVIPIAIDADKLPPIEREANSLNIMTLGSLNYPPNVDGIRWFLQEVFPIIQKQVPQVTLTIIGKSPPQDFIKAAEAQPEHIQVTGYVPELQPYMEAAALMVVPVRAGSGMRVRLLEAFSRAMPAVTTTIGLEGIEATHDQEVLVADTPEDFAAQTIRLLKDTELQEKLASNGRLLAETAYDWKVLLQKMDKVYDQADRTKHKSRTLVH
jgi:glycosyltransferase involved in cell wall biosynthesis